MYDGHNLPILPEMLFRDVVDYLHECYNYVGAQKLDQIFNCHYYSPNALKHLKMITNSCLECGWPWPKDPQTPVTRLELENGEILELAMNDLDALFQVKRKKGSGVRKRQRKAWHKKKEEMENKLTDPNLVTQLLASKF